MRNPGWVATALAVVFLAILPAAWAQQGPPNVASDKPAAGRLRITGKAAIREALKKKISVDFEEVAFAEVLVTLRNQTNVNLEPDLRALDDVGVDLKSPVTKKQSAISARVVFESILRDLKLTLIVQEEQILITSPEEAANKLETVVYDVTDLVVRPNEQGKWCESSDPLVTVIADTLQPQSWDTVGGAGSIGPLSLPRAAVLVVSQTNEVHEELEDLLAQLRKIDAARRQRVPAMAPTEEQLLQRVVLRTAKEDSAVASERIREMALANKIAPDPDRDALVRGLNHFAWDLYPHLAKDSGNNLLYSPVNVATMLRMLQAGARGRTAEELVHVLHVLPPGSSLPESRVQAAFTSLLGTLRAKRATNGYELATAHCLWRQAGREYLPAYEELLSTSYHANVAVVDFRQPDEAARKISRWINEQTDHFLHADLDPGMFHDQSIMALTGAICFRGFWADPFEPAATKPAPFRTGGKKFEVPMMMQLKSVDYAEVDGIQLMQKRYLGEAVSMLFALPPDRPDALEKLEKQLSPGLYAKWLHALRSEEVEIHLPRFTFNAQYRLNTSLNSLGIKTAFQPSGADFSGIDGRKNNLFLQLVLHQARIEVDEQGTRAAAAAMGGMGGGMMEPPKRIVFRADHPFLFVIRDVRTGAILFVGRMAQPTPEMAATPSQSRKGDSTSFTMGQTIDRPRRADAARVQHPAGTKGMM